MDRSTSCSYCGKEEADAFCVCAGLPLLGPACLPAHLASVGFHFALPLAAKEHVTRDNQLQLKHWLLALADSQDKLRANLPAVDSCLAGIRTGYEALIQDMISIKDQVIGKLRDFRAALAVCIEQAIQETTANAYSYDYQPSTPLAQQVWTHCWANSSQDIQAFTYEVKRTDERLRDPLEVTVTTSVPELAAFCHVSGGTRLMQQLQVPTEELQRLNEEAARLRDEAAALTKEVATWKAEHAARQLREAELNREIGRLKGCCQALEVDVQVFSLFRKEASQLRSEIATMRTRAEAENAARLQQEEKLSRELEVLKVRCQELEGKVKDLVPYREEAALLRSKVAALEEQARAEAEKAQSPERQRGFPILHFPTEARNPQHTQPAEARIPVLKDDRLTFFHSHTFQPTHTTLNRKTTINQDTACCYLSKDTLLCCGGYIKPNYLKEVWEVKIGPSTAERVTDMSEARTNAGLWKYGGWVYVFGGFNGGSLRSGEKYRVERKAWTTLCSLLHVKKWMCSVCELSDYLYISGCDGDTGQSTIERFHPQAETFTLLRIDSFYVSILCSDGDSLYCIHDDKIERGDANGAFAVLSTFTQIGDGDYWLRCPLQWSGELTSVLHTSGSVRGLFRFNPAGQFSQVLKFDY